MFIISHSWEANFEKTFNGFLKPMNREELKIIIGQEPYKQELNGTKFKVNSSNPPYNVLGNMVSFFVADWIKIQDSLEMIFNLLCNGSENSIKVLSYLRENNIPAEEFANYLFKRYGLVLTNVIKKEYKILRGTRYSAKECNNKFRKKNKSKKQFKIKIDTKINNKTNTEIRKYTLVEYNTKNIEDFVNKQQKRTYLLLVGEKAASEVKKLNIDITNSVEFIHPSGSNLNKPNVQQRYYENWYNFEDGSGKKQSIIEKFILFR